MSNSLAPTIASNNRSFLDNKRLYLFKLILQTTLMTGCLFGGVNLILFPTNTHPLAIAAPLILLSLVAMFLTRARYFGLAMHFFLHGSWLVFTFASLIYFGGIRSPSIYFFLLTIIVGGLLMGVKTSRYYSALIIITLSGLYLVGRTELQPVVQLLSLERVYMFAIVNTVLTGFLVEIAVSNISVAFQEATQRARELDEANQQLRLIQQDLEQRVQERTLEIESQKQYYEAIFQNSPMAIVALDMEMNVLSGNAAFERLFRHSMAEVRGKSLDEIIAPSQYWDQAILNTQHVLHGEKVNCCVVRQRKDGSLVDLELFGVPVILDGQQIGVLAIYNDISERKRNEERLQYLATHDFLTGLPNRSLFQDRLQHALDQAQRDRDFLGILFMDLDGFKCVNDTYGHETGDAVLRIVSQRLTGLLRASDMVARLGGDEFAFILDNTSKRLEIYRVAGRILKVLRAPICVKNHTISVSASIGISLYPQDGTNPDDLMRKADHAMYTAKAQHTQLVKYDETIFQQ